jgi:hypothetical protein
MKTFLCVLCVSAFILTGSNQKPDPRITKQAARITALESNIAELTAQADHRFADCTNLFALERSDLSMQSSNFDLEQSYLRCYTLKREFEFCHPGSL